MNNKYIYATNIISEGGCELLMSIIENYDGIDTLTIFVNKKFKNYFPTNKNILIKYQPHFLAYRVFFELYLLFKTSKKDHILFFGNLSPLFRYRAKVSVFVQNVILLENFSFKNYQLFFQKIWFLFTLNNSNQFIVQTPRMKKLLNEKIKIPKNILQIPFYNTDKLIKFKKRYNHDFIYVANYQPHKNHINLFKAWALLAEKGIFPSLIVTIKKNDVNNKQILNLLDDYIKKYELKIENIGIVDHKLLCDKYNQTRALIYPSISESFGIPLIEASFFDLDILASNYQFIFDIVDPNFIFDPQSPISIADTVKSYLNPNKEKVFQYKSKPNKAILKLKLFTPNSFINKIFYK